MRLLEQVNLTVAEVEALRLSDLEGLYQEEAAEKMDVSRQTFGRVLKEARRKIAESLIEGKALKIEGGAYRMLSGFYRCETCGHRFPMPWCFPVPDSCPACGGPKLIRETDGPGSHSMGPGFRHRLGGRGRCHRTKEKEGKE
jgi:predicted DNA-binding protein (UPF0251 family)